MNLLEQLTARIEALPQGTHSLGLRAVLQHVQVAISHLARGQKSGDETAFTDAIYRCNQAFEGSLKEAYRVLADKDPAKLRPYDIENHFQTAKILRPRVLSQFTTYRTEWRRKRHTVRPFSDHRHRGVIFRPRTRTQPRRSGATICTAVADHAGQSCRARQIYKFESRPTIGATWRWLRCVTNDG